MTRITVDIDDALLEQARQELGTSTKVATINAALADVVRRRRVVDAIAAMNEIQIDYTGSHQSFRYGGGRDLTRLAAEALAADEDADETGKPTGQSRQSA